MLSGCSAEDSVQEKYALGQFLISGSLVTALGASMTQDMSLYGH